MLGQANSEKKRLGVSSFSLPAQLGPTDGLALMNSWQASVIKGNAGELATLAGTSEVRSRN